MMTTNEFNKMIGRYPECREIFELQGKFKNEQAFCKLIELKDKIPDALYGAVLRYAFIGDTDEVELDTLVKAFTGINKDYLMDEDELEKFQSLPEKIVIYRGTEDRNEEKPRVSWSPNMSHAKRFGTKHLFKSIIDKNEVMAYFANNVSEEEIVAVVDNYEIVY